MGWSWPFSSNGSSNDNPTSDQPSPSAPPPSTETPTTLPPKTRDEQVDAELQAFLAELNYKPSSSPSNTTSPSSQSQPPISPASSQPRSTSLSPANVYPETLSCRTLFDMSYHCQLPGGQWANVYRYGTLRNCGPLWSEFWWCMRTNRGYMNEEERARRIKMHNWEKDRRYREGPSSEDVWEARKEMVNAGQGPGWGNWEEAQRAEEEWRRSTEEMETRQGGEK